MVKSAVRHIDKAAKMIAAGEEWLTARSVSAKVIGVKSHFAC